MSHYKTPFRVLLLVRFFGEDMRYNESEWREAQLRLEPSGKAPKKYGEGVFRFSAALTLGVIMPRRGWQLIKEAKKYVYLKPPADALRKPFLITIKIPTKKQAQEIAAECYKAGESWMGQLGEWPAWYFHKRSRDMQEIIPKVGGGGFTTRLVDGGPHVSSLHIGEYGIWAIELETTDGVFTYRESGRTGPQENTPAVVLVEGEESDIVLTKYERSKAARDQCVLHHGCSCAVCGFDFESVYGELGRGFIHIHHINPISERGEEYEVDPIRDLVPLCPNCHAMTHRRIPPVSVAELRALFLGKKQ